MAGQQQQKIPAASSGAATKLNNHKGVQAVESDDTLKLLEMALLGLAAGEGLLDEEDLEEMEEIASEGERKHLARLEKETKDRKAQKAKVKDHFIMDSCTC